MREEAEKAKMQAREAVLHLERARTLLAEDDAMQLALKHVDQATDEAQRRAEVLEEWYRRTYSSADSGPPKAGT